MKKRMLAMVMAVMMALSLLPASALATDSDTDTSTDASTTTKQITNSAELVSAIQNQKAGETWILAAGDYDVKTSDGGYTLPKNTTINGSSGPFAFPIYVDNLTIKAADGADVTITSSYNPNSGNWHSQNFITVANSGVAIEGVNLKGNPNTYYDNQCNKAIELVGNAKDFTLKNADLLPIKDSDGKDNSGSIYISVTNPGTTVIENVTMSSWINARAVASPTSDETAAGTVTIKNLTQDFTNNTYAGYNDITYGYAWNPGVTGDAAGITVEAFTIKVDNNSNINKQIFNSNLREGTTIELTEDVTIEEPIAIGIPSITINGDGHTIKYVGDDNNSAPINGALITAQGNGNNAVLQNVTVDTNGKVKHGVQFYCVDGGKLDEVTVNGGAYTSVQVNGATNIAISDSIMNPGAGAYANIEYCMGQNVTTVPTMTVENVTTDASKVPVYVDQATINAVKTNTSDLNNDATTDDQVLAVIKENTGNADVYLAAGEAGLQAMQKQINDATAGSEIDLGGKYYAGTLNISKSITLKNGLVGNVNIVGNPDTISGITLENLTFMGNSQEGNLDTNPSALYVQNANDVTVKNCTFNGPAHGADIYTTAITTNTVEGFTVENSNISNYTMSGYHNPTAKNITYKNNTFTNIQSGIAFDGTQGVTVSNNTFNNANGVRLRPDGENTCENISIEKNKFNSPYAGGQFGSYAIRVYENGYVSELELDHNYWGSANPSFDSLIMKDEGVTATFKTEPYYVNEDMSKLNTSGSTSGGGGGAVAQTYTLTFDTNGGSAIDKVSKASGATIDLGKYVPTREGYTFGGWYSDKDLTKAVTSVKLTANTTVYAKWTQQEVPTGLPFVDVNTGDWFYDDVKYVYENGMMNGVAPDKFSPNATTTRGMIVTILYRLENEPAVSGESPFTDVAAGQWYTDAVNWAAANKVVNGTSPTTFAPNAPITREQMAAILYRYAQFKGYDVTDKADLSKFADAASVSEYAVDALSWANAEGLINGVGENTLSPKGNAVRAQVAAILARFCENAAK